MSLPRNSFRAQLRDSILAGLLIAGFALGMVWLSGGWGAVTELF